MTRMQNRTGHASTSEARAYRDIHAIALGGLKCMAMIAVVCALFAGFHAVINVGEGAGGSAPPSAAAARTNQPSDDRRQPSRRNLLQEVNWPTHQPPGYSVLG